MKNMNVLTLLLLLASTQIYSKVNPELQLIFASQAVDELNKSVSFDNDNIRATELLNDMKDCLAFHATHTKDLANTQNIFKSIPLDSDKLQKSSTDLEARIKTLDDHIDKLDDHGMAVAHKGKIKNRKESRKKAQEELDANLKAIEANDNKLNEAEKNKAKINNLIAQNALAFDGAVESYFASFAQYYAKPGSVYGQSIVISSKYNQNMSITPKKYNELIATLQNGYKAFGSSITIDLGLSNVAPLTLDKVITSIQNMPLSSSSYLSYAGYGLAGIAITAALIGGAAIASNTYQGKDWNDTTDAINTWNAGVTNVNAGVAQAQAAGQTVYNNAINSQAAQTASAAIAQAQAAGQTAYNNVINSQAGQATASVIAQAQAAGQAAYNNAINSPAAQATSSAIAQAQAAGQSAYDSIMNSQVGQMTASGIAQAQAAGEAAYNNALISLGYQNQPVINASQGMAVNPLVQAQTTPVAYDASRQNAMNASYDQYFA